MQGTTNITQEIIDSHLADVLRHGEPRDVLFYLRFVENPNVPTVNARFGNELLPVWAVMSGEQVHVNAAALLKLHPDVNVKNGKGQNPAMKAFEEKHAGLGLMFLRAGTDLTARDNKGVGLLKYIIDTGYPNILREAVNLGLDINQTNIEENKDAGGNVVGRYVSGALAWAIERENWDMLHELVDNGIDRDLQNPAVRQAMKAAESFAHINPAPYAEPGSEKYQRALEAAEQKSAAFMRVITDGIFPDEYKFEGLCKDAETFQRRLVLLSPETQERVLKQTGIMRAGNVKGPEEKRRRMFTPVTADEELIYPKNKSVQTILNDVLLQEIRYGDAKDVYTYLKLGADPNAGEEIGGKPALFAAVEENLLEVKIAQKREEIVRMAKFNGTDPVIPDNLADAFAEYKDGPYQKVKFLLDFGADPNTVHPLQKMSVLERAYNKRRLGIVQLLKKRGARATEGLLIFTAQKGEAQDVEDLFKEYTVTNANGQQEKKVLLSPGQIQKEAPAALKIAVERGKPRMINVFYERGLVPPADSKEGKELSEMAQGKDKTLVLSALQGHYSISPNSQKPLTLDEKIAQLSDVDFKRLAHMAGVDQTEKISVQKEEALSEGSAEMSEKTDTTLQKRDRAAESRRSQAPARSEKQGMIKRTLGMLRRRGRS